MEFKFTIENKEFNINIEDKEDYQIIEFSPIPNIIIYPVYFRIVGYSNGNKFGGRLKIDEKYFNGYEEFLNSLVNQLIEYNFKSLIKSN